MLTTKIKRWGNSYAVRIPKLLLAQLELTDDSNVELRLSGHSIEMIPVRPATPLEELLDLVTPENLHQEIDTGNSVGNESW